MSGMKPFDSDGFAHKSAVAQDTPSRREMLRTLAAASAASLVDPGEVLTRLAMDVPCVAGGPAGELLGTLPLFRDLVNEPDVINGEYSIHWLEQNLKAKTEAGV